MCVAACEHGYILHTDVDGQSCIDVNECEQAACDDVTEDCANTIGKRFHRRLDLLETCWKYRKYKKSRKNNAIMVRLRELLDNLN